MNKQLYTTIGSTALVAALATGYGLNYWSSVQAAGIVPPAVQAHVVTAAQRSVATFAPSQETLASLYDTLSPSVVNIQVTIQAQAMPQNPFRNFPFPFGQDPTAPDQQPAQAEGSGFVYDSDGHIVTNNHVVAEADPDNIIVNFANGHWAKAELVARDPHADLAVLKVTPPEGMSLTPLKLATADSLRVGYYVAAIGSPFGLDETMTLGVVSALDRNMPTGDRGDGQPAYSLPDVIQTDTAINPGNSGGPLLDMKGEVVGVNFAIESPARVNSGVGFAIPVSVVEKVVPALIKEGAYHYAYLGLAGQSINADVAEEHKLTDNTLGVYIGEVVSSGPADKAGLKADDIITAVDNEPVARFEDLLSYLFMHGAPDQKLSLHILRDGKEMTLDVTLGERPQEQANQTEQAPGVAINASAALKTAKQAVTDAGVMSKIESVTAKQDEVNGNPVWVVTLNGEGKHATVTIDAQSGEVLSLDVK